MAHVWTNTSRANSARTTALSILWSQGGTSTSRRARGGRSSRGARGQSGSRCGTRAATSTGGECPGVSAVDGADFDVGVDYVGAWGRGFDLCWDTGGGWAGSSCVTKGSAANFGGD